ncbi:hypothetical protein P8C59_006430 [Phyllachora maydis]|uniref:Uncharacterized protein n=1 Tax=Phyllachora maydis TaxID=1825666 RepID=A0AAD9I6H5_9PEZI|nr:hypothetical protein P8C59_006430 [Phyllachora maydis]
MQLNYYKLLAKTSSYILSFIYKACKRVISKDSTPTTYKQVLKLPRDKRSKWLEAITKEFIQLLELGVFKFLPRSLLPSNHYSICFSYNGNTVADLGPKLSNSSNTTTKLSRDFYSKERPRPLTTTSTTIVDSRNSKGSSQTSIINSSLVPIGFSDSNFTGEKTLSKSTYSYLYKLAKAIREVQWIIRLFSKLYRPIDYPITLYRDDQGSITVANNPALYARTKYTLLKFRYVRE